jgi:hypothetical protein
MATKELSELRHKYKMAYTAYLSCVQALSEASHNGVWPSEDVLKQEETALNELKSTRQALLDELYAYSHKKSA